MIVVAVEHKGIEDFIRDHVSQDAEMESVSIVHSWEEVEDLARTARKILLGERITRHVPMERIVETVKSHSECRWIFWTTEEKWGSMLTKNAEVWNREMGPDDLRHWLKPIQTLIPDSMPSRWFMWSASGTSRRLIMWQSLIKNMQSRYQKGVVVDFDWDQALVTRLWGHGIRDSNYLFAKLVLKTAPWGWVIPAPMPWMPILYEPEMADVKETLAHKANWMVWDLGLNIRHPVSALIITALSAGIVYVEEEGNDEIIRRGLALIKDFNPRCDLWLLGESAASVAGRLGLPVLTLSTETFPPTPSWGSWKRWMTRPLKMKP